MEQEFSRPYRNDEVAQGVESFAYLAHFCEAKIAHFPNGRQTSFSDGATTVTQK